jgi:hypothetical protein
LEWHKYGCSGLVVLFPVIVYLSSKKRYPSMMIHLAVFVDTVMQKQDKQRLLDQQDNFLLTVCLLIVYDLLAS